jgi:hypothetical protein
MRAPPRSVTVAGWTMTRSNKPPCQRANAACARSVAWPRRRRDIPFFHRLRRLTIEDRRPWLDGPPRPLPHLAAERRLGLLSGAVKPPEANVVGERLPWWQIMRERPPGNPAALDGGHCIDKLVALMPGWTSTCFRRRDGGGKNRPFGIGQIRGIGVTGHDGAPKDQLRRPAFSPFSDTL